MALGLKNERPNLASILADPDQEIGEVFLRLAVVAVRDCKSQVVGSIPARASIIDRDPEIR